jgi:endonuclease/exonuclease/phosphatase family metal-dependent hydrolase
VKALNNKGYDCIHSVLTRGVTQIPSGLFLAIKRKNGLEFLIKEVRTWKFTNGADADVKSNKGMLGLKLSIQQGPKQKDLYLFNTHLQASYGEKGYSNIRKAQVTAMAEKIQNWTNNRTDDVLLCGDLNFGASKIETGDDDDEYENQMELLKKIALTNNNHKAQMASELNDEARKGTFMNLKVKDEKERRSKAIVDYIIHGNGFGGNAPQIIEINEKNPCSDHLPVVATMSLSLT